MRTWFQCKGKFIKWDNDYFYIHSRHFFTTVLVHLDCLHLWMTNDEFNKYLANEDIEFMAEGELT